MHVCSNQNLTLLTFLSHFLIFTLDPSHHLFYLLIGMVMLILHFLEATKRLKTIFGKHLLCKSSSDNFGSRTFDNNRFVSLLSW